MTKYELMVIAAAAAAFVLINIIMWSIIAAKEKKAKRKAEQSVPQPQPPQPPLQPQPQPEQPVFRSNKPDPVPMKREQSMPPEQRAVPVVKQQTVRREKRSDFVLLDDIVITHTEERI